MCKHNIKERTAKITGSTTVLKHNRQVANITFQMVPPKKEQNYRPWIWVSVTVTSFDATIQHFNTELFLLSCFIQKTNGSYNLSCSRQILCCRLVDSGFLWNEISWRWGNDLGDGKTLGQLARPADGAVSFSPYSSTPATSLLYPVLILGHSIVNFHFNYVLIRPKHMNNQMPQL
jgi:hypothetical protein